MPSPIRHIGPNEVAGFVRDRCFTPSAHGLMGAELEWLTFPFADPRGRPSPEQLAAVLDRGRALGCGSAVTFEPGGQVELSSLPYSRLADAVGAVATDQHELRRRLLDHGLAMLAVGLDPMRPDRRVIRTPRYGAMEAYFERQGSAGRTMMCGTASLQVNLDLGAPPVIGARWRLAAALGPTLAATFANSPFAGGRPSGFRSTRLAVWASVDRSRAAPVLTDGDPVAAWTRYALEARVMLIRARPEPAEEPWASAPGPCAPGAEPARPRERFVPMVEHFPFGRWLAEGHELGYPTLDDFAYHLTTLFPPVRPRGWLELRVLDALPDPLWRVALAVTTALVNDGEAATRAADAAWATAGLWTEASRLGLSHPALATSARHCMAAALDALPRLGADPVTAAACADFADRYVARSRCPADDLLDAWWRHPSPIACLDDRLEAPSWT